MLLWAITGDILCIFDENGLGMVEFRSTAVDGLVKVVYMLVAVAGLEMVEFLLICSDGLVQVALLVVQMLLLLLIAEWSCNEFFSNLLPRSGPNLLHPPGSTWGDAFGSPWDTDGMNSNVGV